VGPARELGKLLLLFGVILAVAGALLMLGGKLPFRLGRLPGDIAYRGKNGSFYFPIVTCLLLSAGLTLLFWLVNWLRR
jgi:ABC-type tungstate transport system substrate-binding protein